MRKFPLVAFLICTALTPALLSSPSLGGQTATNDAGRRWWSYVQYLADDKLEGRLTGSEGHRQAAEFVAEQFQKDGLLPAGTSGYIQPVKFLSRHVNENQSSLALVRGGKTEPLALGEDAIISARFRSTKPIDASLVFAGYGLSIPELHYDDFQGLDLRGKLAVYVYGGPSSVPGPLRSHYSSLEERWKALKRAGALGSVVLFNPHHMDIPWTRLAVLRTQSAMLLADPALDEAPGMTFSATLNPAHAESLFQGSGHTFDELISLADAGKPLPTFPLPVSLKGRATTEQEVVTSQNIAGKLPGTDAKLSHEYVVLSAHVDHLGVGEPINGDRIYNGAMDNASGVATMLDTAAALHESGTKLKRSVLFLIVTGEEKGLLGSRYFVAHPTVPLASIVGDLNVDMFLPIIPLKILTVLGLHESDLGPLLRSVADSMGIEIQDDPQPERNLFIRSDQYNFIKAGVPSIYFKVGARPGSPEAVIEKQWLTDHYHAPSDDTNQHVDLAAAAKYNQVVLHLAEAMADRDQRPQWTQDSFFRRYVKNHAAHGGAR
jgi:peptidase M28-like protein